MADDAKIEEDQLTYLEEKLFAFQETMDEILVEQEQVYNAMADLYKVASSEDVKDKLDTLFDTYGNSSTS